MSSNSISKALGLTPVAKNGDIRLVNAPQTDTDNEEARIDVDRAREGLYNAREMSETALEEMINIANKSQNAKAYEILNSMIKTFADINMSLAELQQRKQKIVAQESGEDKKVVNNNVFIGSTQQLQQLLLELKNKQP